jgi:hypothetical protein
MKKPAILLVILTLLVLEPMAVAEDFLTLFAYPPSNKISWNSPRNALLSFFGIAVKKVVIPGKNIDSFDPWGEITSISSSYRSTMGHTIAHINCTTSDGTRFDDWSSFSGQDFIEVDKENVLQKKLGLGVLFYDYIDGHIIRGEENINRLIFYKGHRKKLHKIKPRYLQFEISTESCDQLKKMASFFEEFHYKKNSTLEELKKRPPSQTLYFTTNLDPYESYLDRLTNPYALVGGGCAPYAIGLIKAAKLYDDSLDSLLKLEIDVSEKLIGSRDYPMTLASLLFGKKGKHWTYDGHQNRHMSQYDPQKIWDFIGEIETCVNNNDDECKLESVNWYMSNKDLLSKGKMISITNQEKNKTVNIKGILVKNLFH